MTEEKRVEKKTRQKAALESFPFPVSRRLCFQLVFLSYCCLFICLHRFAFINHSHLHNSTSNWPFRKVLRLTHKFLSSESAANWRTEMSQYAALGGNLNVYKTNWNNKFAYFLYSQNCKLNCKSNGFQCI